MIGRAGWWTQTSSSTPLLPTKWNAHFWIVFNFWWSAGLVDELEPHLPLLSYQKNEMLIFGLCSTSDDQPGCSMDSNPICHPSPAKKWNAHFWIIFNFWWLAGLVEGLKPHPPPLSTPKNEMLIFGLCSTSDDWPGWSMDSNPIHHPSPPKNMKCLFLYNIQHLMLARLVNGHKPHLPPLFSQKNEMLLFWITLNFWWLAGLVNGLKPHLPPLSSQKMKCSFLDYVQLLMTGRAGQWTRKKKKCLLLDYVHFWWSAWLIDVLEPHLPPLYYQKNEMLLFWITLNFWWLAGLSDGLKPHPPPLSSQKMKCSILDYIQLLIIGRAGWWTQTPSTTHLQPNKMKSSFLYYVELLMINRAGWWSRTSSANPLQTIKWNAHFWILFNFWWSARLVNGPEPHPPRISSQKHEMLIYRFCSTSDDQPGWSRDSNPIHHPSPANKMKCSFLDYAQLLMIGQAGWWTRTPSTTPLQPKKMKCLFLDYVHFWWSAWLIDELEPHLPPLSYQKNEILIFGFCSTSDDQPDWSMDSNPIHHSSPAKKNEMLVFRLCSLLMICLADWWTWTPSATPLQPKKWNAQFLIMFNFWWSARLGNGLKPHPPPFSSHKNEMPIFHYVQLLMLARLVNGLKPHPPPLSSQKNEMLIFGLHSTFDDWPGWLMDSNPIHHPSPAKKMKFSFLY